MGRTRSFDLGGTAAFWNPLQVIWLELAVTDLSGFSNSLNPVKIFLNAYPSTWPWAIMREMLTTFYRYTNYPEPHYYYSFRYGNAEFFVLDSNRTMESGSEQFQWLEKELMKSEATWKFVIHHHPPYTSEENDYGSSWTEPSLHGDPKSKPLVPLYEKYKVDFVLSGHLHTYERTWPLKNGKIDLQNGVRYLIAGGGGGSLEDFAPIPVWFSNKIHLKHHYTMFHIFENHIEFRAIDIDGNTFDSFSYSK